jgi:coenzyme F420-0:L-glutamate ligase/coenzyme F420-1:gamma-L-glutamate ligase
MNVCSRYAIAIAVVAACLCFPFTAGAQNIKSYTQANFNEWLRKYADAKPDFKPGDVLARHIIDSMSRSGVGLEKNDVLVVAQKIVSKAEGRLVCLDDVVPSAFACSLARTRSIDARMAELVLRESRRIVRMNERVIITETHHGLICANAGVDCSNVPQAGWVALLPQDPDASASRLREDLKQQLGVEVAVIICDTFGRPWREGLCEVAIGVAGMKPFRDFRQRRDPHGYRLRASVEAVADELACMAGLACGKLSRSPV